MLEELTRIGFIRSGSVAPRFNYCGKANCRCYGDPPQAHGPYLQWKAKVNGKTVNRRLSARETELYREWIGNDRRPRALIGELRRVAEKATNLILEAETKVQSKAKNRVDQQHDLGLSTGRLSDMIRRWSLDVHVDDQRVGSSRQRIHQRPSASTCTATSHQV